MGSLTQKNCRTPPRTMASDRSLSSASPSSRAPHESPCLATAGAGSSCTTQWLLQSRSARPRERFSDLLTMIGGTTNTFGVRLSEFLGPESWPLGTGVQHMGSLGIMFGRLRRQCGARRGRQRCRRRGHRDHGGQLQPTFRAEYGGLLRCRRCSRCLPASGQAGHRLGGCQVAWGARELRRRRPSQTPQWTPGRVPSAALPEAAAAFPSGLIVHVVVFCAGMNVSVVRSAGGGRWSNPPSPPGASRVRGGVLHRIYDEYGSQKARHTRFLALFQPQLTCPQHRNTQS